MWIRNLSRTLAIAAACIVFCSTPLTTDASTGLRSAYLGASVWEDNLNAKQVNTQLREHFAEVITRLENKNASSLLTALKRAEATSHNRWSTSERRAALAYLAHNRETQIARLRSYADRGLFPINEGQSPDAVPIFVDRRNTHCAVGYLMHIDGRDAEVANVVSTNNLVKVMDAKLAGLSNWIRTSGLTREEAAMIQPEYPINLDATFQELLSNDLTINGITISDVSVRGTRFNVDLPQTLVDSPETFQTALEMGRLLLDSNNVVGAAFRTERGVLFGPGPPNDPVDPSFFLFEPNNLDQWIYFGSNDVSFGGLIGTSNDSGNAGIIEVEYTLRSNLGRFSRLALTAGTDIFNSVNIAIGPQSGLLLRSEIYSETTNDLLGIVELSAVDTPNAPSFAFLAGSESIDIDSQAIRIVTYGLGLAAIDDVPTSFQSNLHDFYTEFETTLLGDFDGDGNVDLDDLDQYNQNIGATATGALASLDLDGDGVVGANDFETHYEELVTTSNGQAGTAQGDTNLDGVVNVLGDAFVLVSNLNGTPVTSWSQGDFDGDGTVTALEDAFALVANLGFNNAP